MSELSEQTFARLLEERGLKLDPKAFAAALPRAARLKADAVRLTDYLHALPAGKNA